MLKLGEKGVIPQRDKETYAIAPHIPCGLVTPTLLRKIADVAETYNAQALKITGAHRIAIIGLREADIDAAWEDLGLDIGAAVGLCVRSIRACPGTTYCRLGKQDSLKMGMILDERYHGMTLPAKFKMAVSGCKLNCVESPVRDLGLTGKKEGWTLTLGGSVGANPRIGEIVAEGLDDETALSAVSSILDFYKDNAKPAERLNKVIQRVGLDAFADRVS